MDNEETTGLDRRQLIKRSAVVGGALVWATPVVQSVAAPAFAATGSPSCSYEVIVYDRPVNDPNKQCTAAFDCSATAQCCECRETGDPVCESCESATCTSKPCP